MEQAVRQAVQVIRERYAEPLSLDDIARAALVSKFHLLRMFSQVTGVTPGRFLSAVRIGEAKRLLRYSDLGVACISSTVGYSSCGSFTKRFTESVGMPPVQYRRLSRCGGEVTVRSPAGAPGGLLLGVARAVAEPGSAIWIGAFDGPILQGHPSSWTTAEQPGPFALHRVPYGVRWLHATAWAGHGPPGETRLLTATAGPLRVGPYTAEVDLVLGPRDWSRPPILYAVPGLEALAEPASRPGLEPMSSGFK